MAELSYVTSTDGVRLAVHSSGDPDAPTIVAIHGYPDNAAVWEPVAAILEHNFRVVRYDVRGTGSSDKPRGRRPYRLDQLEADFDAVLGAVSPTEPVHLLGHDWGSVQGWHFVTSPALQTRIASFSSISGPSLDYARHWLRAKLRPSRADLGALLGQLAHSYYLLFFQLPWLPELAWKSGLTARLLGGANKSGYARSTADELNGLQLYRANLAYRRQPPAVRTEIAVQVLAPEGDPFVGVAWQLQAPAPFVTNLHTRQVPGGHWIPLSQPDLVAEWVRDFVTRHA